MKLSTAIRKGVARDGKGLKNNWVALRKKDCTIKACCVMAAATLGVASGKVEKLRKQVIKEIRDEEQENGGSVAFPFIHDDVEREFNDRLAELAFELFPSQDVKNAIELNDDLGLSRLKIAERFAAKGK